MKTYALVTLPAQPERTDLKAIALICGLCNKEIKYFHDNGVVVLNPIIKERYGGAADVQVQLKAGEHNLNGGVGETISFDICPRCFEERLQRWLEQQGAEAKVEPWSS